MTISEAFNYMKRVIKNGIKNNFKVENVKSSIEAYITTLEEENALTEKDLMVLTGVNEKLSEIMERKITADEVFVNVLSNIEDSRYESCSFELKKETKKQKKDTYKPRNYWASAFNIPEENCGRLQACREKTLLKELTSTKPEENCGRFRR